VADVGQEEDFEAARQKALKVGAKKFILDASSLSLKSVKSNLNGTVRQDLKAEFINELIYPAVQANAIYEVCFLLFHFIRKNAQF